MIHIYTGNGKGKTTAAFGLGMRANGQGLKVIIFQFMKPKSLVCGEELAAKKIKNIKIVKFGQAHPMFIGQGTRDKAKGKIRKSIDRMFGQVEKAIFGKRYNMVVLDEIINVVDQGFAKRHRLLKLLSSMPKEKELVLTGRGDISEIEPYADYVTIMIDKKHPFRRHIGARKGIEY